MKREFEKHTKQINSHTYSETTRVIGELGGQTERMNAEIQAMRQERVAAKAGKGEKQGFEE